MVDDVAEGAHELLRQRLRRGDRARYAPLRWALDSRERAHAEPQLSHRDAPLAQPLADGIRQQGQLVSPYAARHPEEEDAVVQRDGVRAVGDACPYGVAPHLGRDGRVPAGEAALPRAIEDRHEGLRRRERKAGEATHAEQATSFRARRR
jgi:hypothetical protein